MNVRYRAFYLPHNKIYRVNSVFWDDHDQIKSAGLILNGHSLLATKDEMELLPLTNCFDTNKKEICKGDYITDGNYIMLVTWSGDISRMMQYDCQECVASIDKNNKYITSNGIREYHSDDWISNPQFWKVIGNKYENPDLIPQ